LKVERYGDGFYPAQKTTATDSPTARRFLDHADDDPTYLKCRLAEGACRLDIISR